MTKDELNRFRASLQGVAFEDLLSPQRAPVGPVASSSYRDLARAARAKLDAGQALSPAEAQALERAIRMLRPAVKVASAGGVLSAPLLGPSADAFPGWPDFFKRLAPRLRTIGAVECQEAGGWTVYGTGFLVREDLLLTNRHVAENVTFNTLEIDPQTVRVNFEAGLLETLGPASVLRVVGTGAADVALLEIEPQDGVGDQLLRFASSAPRADAPLAVVGHPVTSDGYPDWVAGLFSGPLGLGAKCLAPGLALAGTGAGAVLHDATTVKGNSGSPVLSMADGTVVGLHFQGEFLYRNSAVPAAALQAFLASV